MERQDLAIHGCGEAKMARLKAEGITAPRPVCYRELCTFSGLAHVVGQSRSSRSSDMRDCVECKKSHLARRCLEGATRTGGGVLPSRLACVVSMGVSLLRRLRTRGQFTEKVLVFGRRRRSMSGSGVVESRCETGNRAVELLLNER